MKIRHLKVRDILYNKLFIYVISSQIENEWHLVIIKGDSSPSFCSLETKKQNLSCKLLQRNKKGPEAEIWTQQVRDRDCKSGKFVKHFGPFYANENEVIKISKQYFIAMCRKEYVMLYHIMHRKIDNLTSEHLHELCNYPSHFCHLSFKSMSHLEQRFFGPFTALISTCKLIYQVIYPPYISYISKCDKLKL